MNTRMTLYRILFFCVLPPLWCAGVQPVAGDDGLIWGEELQFFWRHPWVLVMGSLFAGLILLLTWLLIRNRKLYLQEKQAEHERTLAERQAEREKHVLEMNRLKTGFFTNISHELRTPLTVILGPLEMMLAEESDPKRKKVLSMMVRNAQRVATLITQLLDFRKIEQGRIGIEATYGDLVSVVEEVVALMQLLAGNARISCYLEGPAECRGWFDFDKLQKIFTTLIANSIKYTPAGGEVRVTLREERDAAGHCQVYFVVEDTGVGIAREHLEHIFDRFYRVPETSMAVGAGIGLNLTRELVELLGGEIQVESPIHPDAARPGTRFTVRLPVLNQEDLVSQRREVAQSSDLPRSSDGESPLILVVEDDEDIRAFIVDGLASGYRVETAGDGEAGLQMAKDHVPDLVITDVMVPVMDGVTLCRELKTSMETSHIPVVMLTAKVSLEHQLQGLKAGADDYLAKPFHMELLKTRIANLLESRRLLREKFFREYPILTPDIPESSQDKEFLEKAMRVMEESYWDVDFDSDRFACGVNMSLSTLQRKLGAVANRTPSEFISEFRMLRAAELLIMSVKPVTEISVEIGCAESEDFTRTFEKYFNMSPATYRALHRPS